MMEYDPEYRAYNDMKNQIKELEAENEALCRTLTEAEDKINELKLENRRLRRSLAFNSSP